MKKVIAITIIILGIVAIYYFFKVSYPKLTSEEAQAEICKNFENRQDKYKLEIFNVNNKIVYSPKAICVDRICSPEDVDGGTPYFDSNGKYLGSCGGYRAEGFLSKFGFTNEWCLPYKDDKPQFVECK